MPPAGICVSRHSTTEEQKVCPMLAQSHCSGPSQYHEIEGTKPVMAPKGFSPESLSTVHHLVTAVQASSPYAASQRSVGVASWSFTVGLSQVIQANFPGIDSKHEKLQPGLQTHRILWHYTRGCTEFDELELTFSSDRVQFWSSSDAG
ncbi:MAG: hypothetical protein Q9174_004620 [Haloplaca sp. 1 TL-2023]